MNLKKKNLILFLKNDNVILHVKLKELNKETKNYKKLSKLFNRIFFKRNFKTILIHCFYL